MLRAGWGCSEQRKDAEGRSGMSGAGWGCSGHLHSVLPGDASLGAPCLAGLLWHGGPSALALCRQLCRGLPAAPRAGRRSLPSAGGTGADWPRGTVLLLWLCPG